MGGPDISAEHGLFRSALKPGPRARALWRGTLDLVFPPQTIDGGLALAGGLSAVAWSRIQFLDGPVCDGCGVPFEYDIGSRCAACLARPRAFDAARAACLYDDTSREPILKLKHADRLDLAPLFARWLSRAARAASTARGFLRHAAQRAPGSYSKGGLRNLFLIGDRRMVKRGCWP